MAVGGDNCKLCKEYKIDNCEGHVDECICKRCPRNLGKCICLKYCSETESILNI